MWSYYREHREDCTPDVDELETRTIGELRRMGSDLPDDWRERMYSLLRAAHDPSISIPSSTEIREQEDRRSRDLAAMISARGMLGNDRRHPSGVDTFPRTPGIAEEKIEWAPFRIPIVYAILSVIFLVCGTVEWSMYYRILGSHTPAFTIVGVTLPFLTSISIGLTSLICGGRNQLAYTISMSILLVGTLLLLAWPLNLMGNGVMLSRILILLSVPCGLYLNRASQVTIDKYNMINIAKDNRRMTIDWSIYQHTWFMIMNIHGDGIVPNHILWGLLSSVLSFCTMLLFWGLTAFIQWII